MDRRSLIRVALSLNAIFVENVGETTADGRVTPDGSVMALVSELARLGFAVSEDLLHALCHQGVERLQEIADVIGDVMGTKRNWAPLVRGWDVPTGESLADHLATCFAQQIEKWGIEVKGTRLPCGHLIPEGTFPLERYNGCPFCGRPFETASYVHYGQGSARVLRCMTVADMRRLLAALLTSPTPLDKTQQETIATLLREFGLPKDISIGIRETAVIVGHILLKQHKEDEVQRLIKTPTDILRLLWYEKTGHVLIIKPKTLIGNAMLASQHVNPSQDRGEEAAQSRRESLKLHYGRERGHIVAKWLNEMPLTAQQACENMNPTREMWVRLIRALRLSEHAKKDGYRHLAELLDVFYNKRYKTWSGALETVRQTGDAEQTLRMLQSRPGVFARQLFSTMLRFGSEATLKAFGQVADELPKRLLISLCNAADIYFDTEHRRVVRTIASSTKRIAHSPLLSNTSEEEREAMLKGINDIYLAVMHRHFAKQKGDSPGRTIYIAPELYDTPVGVGDRSSTVQATSCALMGTRFKVEGTSVRLFLQWGVGLKAQHLDMDLSCLIVFADGRKEECAYFNLTATGAKHSGDIQEIPDDVGTAEYIELTLPEMEQAGVRYVVFTCNAYTAGHLSPNLMVGWMDSAYEMKISKSDGVAYDPSCVQHMVKIGEGNLSKGLVFGVLEVGTREITWLETPFMGQTIRSLDVVQTEAYLRRLRAKVSIGETLDIKAEAQGLKRVDSPQEADEAYTYEWALNSAAVSKMLLE